MKKFSVLIALVLLAVAGTGYAVTCAYDNVPAATLLVPYFKVSLNGATGFPIAAGGTDTLVSVVNVSTPGVIAHVTVWNKYSKAVIDFNLPLTGKDVVSFSMRDIMNGKLSPNYPQCGPDLSAADLAACLNTKGSPPNSYPVDPCGLVDPGLPSASYEPSVGFGQTQFIRFSHPDAAASGIDVLTSISQYNLTSVDAIGAGFRGTVWNSLDESGDITSFTSSGGTNILDKDNPACGWAATNPLGGALSGYLTIDVVNYCTNFFPDQADFYNKDAIATAGWTQPAYPDFPCAVGTTCPVTYTPNVLIGDVFYVDTATQGGNVSGDPAVAIEFDSRLPFTGTAVSPLTRTFFGKFVAGVAIPACAAEATVGCSLGSPVAFQFPGDGREPLGDHYGFRFLADQASGIQSWITVWRSDWYNGLPTTGRQVNLCQWADPTSKANNGKSGTGLFDDLHQVQILTYDNDENLFGGVGIPPGPSGPPPGSNVPNYIFLESQRIDLLGATAAGTGWNPAQFKGGWVDMKLDGPGYDGLTVSTGLYNMGWVGVQHTAPGAFISVGHAASNLSEQFLCQPNRFDIGTWVDFNSAPEFVRSGAKK